MRKRVVLFGLGFVVIIAAAGAGEKPFSWTDAPPDGHYIAVPLGQFSLGKYLAASQMNRPEVLQEVKTAIAQGEYYRKNTKDQKGKPTLLTAYVDPGYMLYIITYRSETCPTCNGTGKRNAPFDKVTRNVNVNFRCLDCKGEGELPHQRVEKAYILSSEDFENPNEGRRIMQQRAYANAPRGADAWVERLASPSPQERLQACQWLDENYVKVGVFFQDIMPMLKKARYHDSNEKKRIMVWQFWAGKDLPREKNRAYYRIYADTKTGKITKKGFFAGS